MNIFLFCGDVFCWKGSFPAIAAVAPAQHALLDEGTVFKYSLFYINSTTVHFCF